jgi:hypothetical protein
MRDVSLKKTVNGAKEGPMEKKLDVPKMSEKVDAAKESKKSAIA